VTTLALSMFRPWTGRLRRRRSRCRTLSARPGLAAFSEQEDMDGETAMVKRSQTANTAREPSIAADGLTAEEVACKTVTSGI